MRLDGAVPGAEGVVADAAQALEVAAGRPQQARQRAPEATAAAAQGFTPPAAAAGANNPKLLVYAVPN